MADWLTESIKWYAALVVITWAIAPIVRWLCGRSPDQGASIGRPVALLLMIWPTWWLAGVSPLRFSTAGLWITLLLLGGGGWFYVWQAGWIERKWLVHLLAVEAVSLAVFTGFIAMRGYTPQVVFTEQPMDMAFFASASRTAEIPPADPWFGGEPINYYYLGHLIHSSIGRMASVPTWVGYNLALATTASMVFTGAAGLAWHIARDWLGKQAAIASAILAGFFLLLSGNMLAIQELVKAPRAAFEDYWWGRIGWASSRIVVDNGSQQAETINEFPWFSLLLGDLHPHLTALAFTVMALALIYALLIRPGSEPSSTAGWARLAVTGGLIGALYPLNSLDLPTYLLIATGALILTAGLTHHMLKQWSVLIAAALIAWLPFTLRFVPFAGGDASELPGWAQNIPVVTRLATTLGFFAGEHTSAGEFLTVFGIFWCIVIVALAVAAQRRIAAEGFPHVSPPVVGMLIVMILAAVALPAPVVLLAGLPLLAALWLLAGYRRQGLVAQQFITGLAAAALALLVGTEFFYVQDSFAGRYNTLFKVYYQVWTLLAISCAVALVALWRVFQNRTVARAIFAIASVALLLSAAAYPFAATAQWTRVHGPRDWQGLDGIAYFAGYSVDDLAAIRWLSENARQDEILLEAPGCSYQVNGAIPTGRLAAFTGVPNVIGWDFHEVQWRGGQQELLDQITPRAADVAAMYADPASPLFEKYGVTLLFVGNYERNGAGDSCAKAGPFLAVAAPDYPGSGWTAVFASGEARIYRREET